MWFKPGCRYFNFRSEDGGNDVPHAKPFFGAIQGKPCAVYVSVSVGPRPPAGLPASAALQSPTAPSPCNGRHTGTPWGRLRICSRGIILANTRLFYGSTHGQQWCGRGGRWCRAGRAGWACCAGPGGHGHGHGPRARGDELHLRARHGGQAVGQSPGSHTTQLLAIFSENGGHKDWPTLLPSPSIGLTLAPRGPRPLAPRRPAGGGRARRLLGSSFSPAMDGRLAASAVVTMYPAGAAYAASTDDRINLALIE